MDDTASTDAGDGDAVLSDGDASLVAGDLE